MEEGEGEVLGEGVIAMTLLRPEQQHIGLRSRHPHAIGRQWTASDCNGLRREATPGDARRRMCTLRPGRSVSEHVQQHRHRGGPEPTPRVLRPRPRPSRRSRRTSSGLARSRHHPRGDVHQLFVRLRPAADLDHRNPRCPGATSIRHQSGDRGDLRGLPAAGPPDLLGFGLRRQPASTRREPQRPGSSGGDGDPPGALRTVESADRSDCRRGHRGCRRRNLPSSPGVRLGA